MNEPLRAAVIGGSGIGKFHAQWYALEGARFVAFSCTSDEAVRAAAGPIRDLTRQDPKGYADVREMLERERPDVVSVCSPPADHPEATLVALESGAHVLCEKPILHDARLSCAEMLARSGRMVSRARELNRILAVNLQYAAALSPYREFYERRRSDMGEFNSYEFRMESKGNRHGALSGEGLWVDLGPHTLTPLLLALPNSDLVEESVRAEGTETEIRVEMELQDPGGHRTTVRLRTGTCAKDAVPVRRFGFNGFVTDLLARKGEDGIFTSVLREPESGEERVAEDFMRTSVRRFLRSVRGSDTPLVTGEAAHRNLGMALAVADRLGAV